MPPKAFVNLADFDLTKVVLTPEQIYGPILPHKFELALVSGVHVLDTTERKVIIGWKDVRADEFWCRGHFPTWPVLPGVLIVEAVAQLALVYYRKTIGSDGKGTLLFGGIDEVKFREAVTPGKKLLLVCIPEDLKLRRSKFKCQALVDGKVVFEGSITGILGPDAPAG